MGKQKKPVSTLEYLIQNEVLPEGTSLEDAVDILTDPLNCVECIAAGQCADRYGSDFGKNAEADCMEVMTAFLKQDHKEVKENDS